MTDPTPTTPDDRLDRLKQYVAELHVPEPAPGRERRLAGAGVALMVVGVALGGLAYTLSHSTTNPLQQNDAVVLAVAGVAVVLVGGFVFLRYSLAGFLRFWLARQLFDQREREEQLVQLFDQREREGKLVTLFDQREREERLVQLLDERRERP